MRRPAGAGASRPAALMLTPMLALTLTGAMPAAPARQLLGVYGGWGAFRDQAPSRCYAISRPAAASRRTGAFASVATWPGRGVRGSVAIRLSRPRDAAAAITLSVGDRRFTLVGTATDAWAADGASDRAVTTALRGGRSMSVETIGRDGRAFADVYALAGAATAIDAAALGCAGH